MDADWDPGPHFSPWAWDVQDDVVWALPEFFTIHGCPLPADAPDENGLMPLPREGWLEALPSERREWIRAFCDRVRSTRVGGEVAYSIAAAGGIRSLVLHAAVGESDAGGSVRVVGYVRDLTAERVLSLVRAQTRRGLAHQRSMLERIAAGDPLEETLESVCRHIELIHPGVFCAVMMHDGQAGVLRSVVAPSLAEDFCAAVDGQAADPADVGAFVVIEDVTVDERAATARELYEAYALRSLWSCPLRATSGEVLGSLVLYRSAPYIPPEPEIRSIDGLGRLAALAIERDAIHASVQRSANVYPPTGLLDRAGFQQALESRLGRPFTRTALLFVELDGFEHLGEDLGQETSAALLAEVARRLRASGGHGSVIGRYSADEFTIAVDCGSALRLSDLASRVQGAFSAPVCAHGHELFLVATVGVAVASDRSDARGLIGEAAEAKQAAGSRGHGGDVVDRDVVDRDVVAPAPAEQLGLEVSAPRQLRLISSNQNPE